MWLAIFIAILVSFGLRLDALIPIGSAASFVVDRTDDDPTATACTAAPNDCSLRGAIIAANVDAIGDTINVPAGTYTLTQVGSGEDLAADGDLDITKNLIIEGAGVGTTIIDGNGLVTGEGVFSVGVNASVDISFLSITGGTASQGGGIRVSGTLSIDNCELYGNSASSAGGGIYGFRSDITIFNCNLHSNHALGSANGGAVYTYTDINTNSLTIQSSVFSNNDAGVNGGAILSNGDAVTIWRTTINDNTALSGDGGGIFKNDGSGNQIEILDSTITGNTAGAGGGLFFGGQTSAVITRSTIHANIANTEDAFDGGAGIRQASTSLSITNSTITGNMATNNGGGLLTGIGNGGMILTNVTITENAANSDSSGGGDGGGVYSGSGTLAYVNTIIAGNSGDQCASVGSGTLTSIESNLSSDSTCNLINASDLPATDPGLDVLADNGGATETHALLPGSAAIDAGHPTFCPVDDQRWADRPIGPDCDIGAYEAPLWLFMPLITR
jgi:predicted outer membrane repeat protein